MLTKNTNKGLTEWQPINKTILRAWCQSKFQKLSIIQCCAPTNTADQEMKKEFYERLQRVLQTTPHRDTTILLGDYNAKVRHGKSTREQIMGKEDFGTLNQPGQLLTDFSEQNHLVIAGLPLTRERRPRQTTLLTPAGGEEPCKTSDLIQVRMLDHSKRSSLFQRTTDSRFQETQKIALWRIHGEIGIQEERI